MHLSVHAHARKLARMPVQSPVSAVTWMRHALVCVFGGCGLRPCARKRVQLLLVSESKDKRRLSACLPAARVIDVDGNTQTTAEEPLTHERQTKRLAPSFDGQISNSRRVQSNPIEGFIYSSFNFCFSLKTRMSTVYCSSSDNSAIIVTFPNDLDFFLPVQTLYLYFIDWVFHNWS